MARSVLGVVAAWAWFTLASPVHGAGPVPCSDKRPTVQKLQKHLSEGPLFRAMSVRYGKPRSCTVKLDGEKISMAYVFRGGARVGADVDPSIEYSQERADVPGMDAPKALTLLKEAERYSRPDGCGMQWTDPEEERSTATAGSRDVIYRGSGCNCQARMTYKGTSVIALVLRSAC